MTLQAASRNPALDTLRGIAIFAVMLAHALAGLGYSQHPEDGIIALGRGGVTLFFLLSGYLIFHSVQREPAHVFALRRFFKVMPSYWINILVILVLDFTVTHFAHLSWKSYASDATVLTDILGLPPTSGVFWTLFIEIKFYVFVLIQYALIGSRYNLLVAAGLLLIEVSVWTWRGHGSTTLAYFPVFYVGIEIALAEVAGWTRVHIARVVGITLVLAASLYVFLDRLQVPSAVYLITAAILFVVAQRLRFSNRVFVFLGVTSYSAYLYHSLVMGWLIDTFPVSRASPGIFMLLVGVFLAAVMVGAVMYRLIEVPFVRLGRRLETWEPIAYIGRHDHASR